MFNRQPIHQSPLWFSVLTITAASCLSLLGGIGLELVGTKIITIMPLVVALPALNTMAGDYAAIVAAHAGDPAERPQGKRQLARVLARVLGLNVAGIVTLSLLVAASRGYVLTGDFIGRFSLFVALSIVVIVTAIFAITTLLDRILEQRRLNPDDILIPVVNSIANVMMLGLIALSVVTIFA